MRCWRWVEFVVSCVILEQDKDSVETEQVAVAVTPDRQVEESKPELSAFIT